MQHHKLSMMLATLAATVGVAAFAASAQAAVVDTDGVSLNADPEVSLDGEVAFDIGSGGTIPKLTGTLAVVDGDDACFRTRVASYNGATFLHDKPGFTRCLKSDNLREFPVTLKEDANLLTDRVVVSVEKDGPQGWTTKEETTVSMTIRDDVVTVLGSGVDIGGPLFAAGEPTSGALVSWQVVNGVVTPSYDGDLHFEGFSRCGRVMLRILGEGGTLLEELPGPQHCPPDLAHVSFNDVLAGTPSALAVEMEVVMQTKSGGQWNEVDSETVSIADPN